MSREIFEPLALFLIPFAAYAIYLVLRARWPLEVEHWTGVRVSILTLIGLAAAVLGLVAIERLRAARPGRLRAGARGERRAGPGPYRMSGLPGARGRPAEERAPPPARAGSARARGVERRRRRDAARRRGGARPRPRPRARRLRPRHDPAAGGDDRVARPPRASRSFRRASPTAPCRSIMDGQAIETTTLREDVETDGRHARVAFGRDFLGRRAPARLHHQRAVARRRGPGVRPARRTGRSGRGPRALHRRRRRADPGGSSADPALLPLLGAVRGGRRSIATASSAASAIGSDLARLSRERVRAEVLKLLVAPRAGEVVRVMGERGILERASRLRRSRQAGTRLAAIEAATGLAPDGAPAPRRARASSSRRTRAVSRSGCGSRTRSASGCTRAASALAPLHGARPSPRTDVLRRLLFAFGRSAASDALMLAHAEADVGPATPISPARGVS